MSEKLYIQKAWRIEIVQNISGLDSWRVGKGCLCLTLSACHFNEYQDHPHTKSRSPRPHLHWEWAPPRTWFSSVKQFQQLKVPLPPAAARTRIAGSATSLVLDYNIGEKLPWKDKDVLHDLQSDLKMLLTVCLKEKKERLFPDRLSSFLIRRVKINILSLLCLPSISLADKRGDLCVGLRVMGKQIWRDATTFFLCQCTLSVSLQKKRKKDLSIRNGVGWEKQSH